MSRFVLIPAPEDVVRFVEDYLRPALKGFYVRVISLQPLDDPDDYGYRLNAHRTIDFETESAAAYSETVRIKGCAKIAGEEPPWRPALRKACDSLVLQIKGHLDLNPDSSPIPSPIPSPDSSSVFYEEDLQSSWHLEKDEPGSSRDLWRIVPLSAVRRRKEQNCSARPSHVAVVFSRAAAQRIIDLHNAVLAAAAVFAAAARSQTNSSE